ncbi:hypothetical protein HO173_010221 [Letharia columbiana]|uniref:SMODS and SLOG-associating 2TM effector domain-containing protein n=1 Tax=Letharia columbiana TaxID=112416 RepID=A0A8H6FMX2_9LECA|nr:uncharacterized protein HO173_010221 [Letharia columbiana]KAF6231469.1 hypothetical protein HO173_010221 [Letharia columbiana]
MGETEPELTYHKPTPTFDRDLEKAGSTDRLSVFREQVGISDVLELSPRASRRPAPNLGIYNRVSTEEHKAKLQYYSSALVINACLLTQVIFASALTALGAGGGSHIQITVLGAANTVIAAILTFTKGSGLPNRLRQYQCTLRKVREYIEQRERDFAQLDCQLDLDHEMKIIKGMYEQARQNDENNDPGTYHNPTAASTANGPLTGKTLVSEPSSILGPDIRQPAPRVASAVAPQVPPMNQPKTEEDLTHNEPTPLGGVDRSATDPAPPRREDSQRYKIAYSVADRLVSGRNPW